MFTVFRRVHLEVSSFYGKYVQGMMTLLILMEEDCIDQLGTKFIYYSICKQMWGYPWNWWLILNCSILTFILRWKVSQDIHLLNASFILACNCIFSWVNGVGLMFQLGHTRHHFTLFFCWIFLHSKFVIFSLARSRISFK